MSDRILEKARELGKPWVLDPVGAGATPYRTAVARELSRREPTTRRRYSRRWATAPACRC